MVKNPRATDAPLSNSSSHPQASQRTLQYPPLRPKIENDQSIKAADLWGFFRIWVGDVPSVEILDRFMVLKEGGVMEQGSHKELLEQWRSSD
jgi:hypothetical protein